MSDLAFTHALLAEIITLRRVGPPGPPPRHGLEWKEETRRWIRPKERRESAYMMTEPSSMFGGEQSILALDERDGVTVSRRA